MIKFLRRHVLFLAAMLIGGGTVISSYMDVTPTPPLSAKTEPICFEPWGADVKPEYVAQSVLVKINWTSDTIYLDGEQVEGMAAFSYDRETELAECTIWVPLPLQVAGDPDMDTLGHEFLHCAIGYFHE